jgi:exopolyphosphatase/guanosine-5'-triphosphate,3'-diphosphate pyrophosphatase
MPSPSVAIIDIGSNSIKVLIASRGSDGNIAPLHIRTIDARISAGISKSEPRLSEEGMTRGVDAVRSLVEDAAKFNPAAITLVATSAVRDALNGAEFCARVKAATGHGVRILTGSEEANLIGRGLMADPALRGLRDFYVFDLGGGSLECLAFRDRTIQQAMSLPLGCVRLTERFVVDATAPLPAEASQAVSDYTRDLLARSNFQFNLPPTAMAVGTGGTVTTVRAILGASEGKSFEATESTVTVEQLRTLLAHLGALPLARRRQISGLPPARADVFPTAIATLLAVASVGKLNAFQNSVFNLRYGLAAEALQKA